MSELRPPPRTAAPARSALAVALVLAALSLPRTAAAQTQQRTAAQAPQRAAAASALPGNEILVLVNAGKFEQARASGMARVAAVRDDMDAYVGLAWSLIAMGRYDEAGRQAERGYAIAPDPRLAQAMGEASFHLGRNDVALARLREYLGSFPEGGKAGISYYLCGELYVRAARFQHADIAFTAALQYMPNNPAWWARLGYARENSGKTLQALKAYERALALEPNQRDAASGRQRLTERLRQ